MSITWGAWSSNNRLRAGIEVLMSPSTLTASTTTVTLTTKVYLQTRYASSESSSSTDWWITGTGVTDGSGNTDWSLGDMGYKLMGSTTTGVTLTSSSQAKPASGKVHSYYAYAGTEASVNTTFTVPARAVAAPAAPISLATSRISDTSQKVSWSRQATTTAPYDQQIVYRKDNVSTSLAAIATVTGTTTSFTDTKTRTDRIYTYAVRAKNAGGYSGYAYAPAIATTPYGPGAPSVKKTSSGDISVGRPTMSAASTKWELWHAANGVWDSAALASLANTVTSYTHTAPDSTKTHTYRVRAVTAVPVLYSAYGITSAGVTPLTPPAAPTNLVPSGVAQEAAEAVTFTWTHNALDTTDQTAYEIQWRPVATTTWTTTGKVASTTSSKAWAANTWANGQTIEWQVRTWGQNATAGPWSASGTLTLSSRPTATITSPADGVAWDSARLRLDWTYGDAEGQVQTGWKVNLYDGDGAVLETLTGADGTTEVRFATRLADGGTYSVDVTVRDSTGLWAAAPDVQVFATDFAQLPTPTVTGEWDNEAATNSVYVSVPVAVSPQVAPDSAEVWRSIDGGPWALVADNLQLTPDANDATLPWTVSVTDAIPALNTTNTYKAIVETEMGAFQESATFDIFTSGAKHVFVNAGPGFADYVRVNSNVSVELTSSRSRMLRRAAGRALPVPFDGQQTSTEVSVSATLWRPDRAYERASQASSWEDIADFALSYSPACFRDPDGNRLFVAMGPVKIAGLGTGGVRSVSWAMTAIDYAEPVVSSTTL